jgi:hypothetical protein
MNRLEKFLIRSEIEALSADVDLHSLLRLVE